MTPGHKNLRCCPRCSCPCGHAPLLFELDDPVDRHIDRSGFRVAATDGMTMLTVSSQLGKMDECRKVMLDAIGLLDLRGSPRLLEPTVEFAIIPRCDP